MRMVKIPFRVEVANGLQFDGAGGVRQFKDADLAVLTTLPDHFPPVNHGGPPPTYCSFDFSAVGHASYEGGEDAVNKRFQYKTREEVLSRTSVNGYYHSAYCFNDHGYLHDEAHNLIEAIAKKGAESPGPWYGRQQDLSKYISKRLSVALAKSYADVVLSTVTKLRSRAAVGQDLNDAPCAFNWVTF